MTFTQRDKDLQDETFNKYVATRKKFSVRQCNWWVWILVYFESSILAPTYSTEEYIVVHINKYGKFKVLFYIHHHN